MAADCKSARASVRRFESSPVHHLYDKQDVFSGMLKKTLLKTASYALMHMGIAILVAYALSGSWRIALAIGLLEPCIQTFAFFFHERAWHRFERQQHREDHHDSVIDSVSPASRIVEDMINRDGNNPS